MVVTKEDEVEARHILGNPFHGILTPKRMVLGKVLCLRLIARVEEAYHQVGMLFLLDDLHPFGCSFFQIVET